MSDLLVLERQPIHLNRFQQAAADRLYPPALFDGVRIERIWYRSDGLRVAGYLAMPARSTEKLPLLIWNRGGNGDRGALDDLTAYLILGLAASWGMIVLASQYRGNKGSDGSEDWGGEDVRDALNLRDVAREIEHCDPSRLALEGASRGGMTTYRLLTMCTGVSAVVVHAGIADVRALVRAKPNFQQLLDRYLGGLSPEQYEHELNRRSLIHFAKEIKPGPPVLLLHGDADTVVPLEQSQLAADALTKSGISNELHILPGAGHVALKDGSYLEVDRRRREWYRRAGLIRS